MGISDVLKFIVDLYGTSTIPVRFAYIFWIVFIVIYIFIDRYEKNHGLIKNRKLKFKNYHGTLYLFGLTTIVIHHCSIQFNWIFFNQMAINPKSITWLGISGFIIMGFGLYLVASARIALDGYWGIHVYEYEDKGKLITNGIYSQCRHPVYAGQWFMTVGTVMLSNNWWTTIFPVGTLILSLWRANKEEIELKERFGEKFCDYKNKASFFIPFIK